MLFYHFVTFIALPWLRVAYTYPGGTPDLSCSSMFPNGHMSAAQITDPPYKISVQKETYSPGETIQVEITALDDHFTGLYVQPRQVGCHLNATRTVGVFTASSPLLQTRHCFGIVHSTLTHTSKENKKQVTFYWTAPVTSSGHVVIKATIVKSFQEFWTDVQSPPMIDLQHMDTPTCVSHTHKEGFHFDHNLISYQAKTSGSRTSNMAKKMFTITSWSFVVALELILIREITQ